MQKELHTRDEAGLLNSETAVEGFELAPQQRRVWELRQSGGGTPYHVQCVVEIEGALDRGALAAAAREVIARHEILRTSFCQLPGMLIPVQVVTDDEPRELLAFDLTTLPAAGREDRLLQWLADARWTREGEEEEEASGAPLRAALFALAERRHALALSLPALCADRAGIENLVKEIAREYGRATRGGAADDDPMQYADLAAWQNELAAAEESELGRAYWRASLPAETGTTQLPWLGRRGRAAQFDPRVLITTVGADSHARLSALAVRHHSGMENLLLACWQLLLRRLGVSAQVVVGVRFAGRKYEELEDAIGPLARYLPVRCEVEDDLRFGELLARTKAATEAAAKWQEYFSWELIRAAASPEAPPPFTPLCFDFATDGGAHESGGATFTTRGRYECLDRFHAKLACRLRSDELLLELHYDASLLSTDDAGRLSEQFQTLLASVGRNPEARVAELGIMPRGELRRVVAEFNETGADFGPLATLHELFEAQARRTPEAVAVRYEGAAVSYAELDGRADGLARRLRRLGVGPEVLVAVCLERSVEMLVGLLGVLKAGAAYVPLDPGYPPERLQFMLEDSCCSRRRGSELSCRKGRRACSVSTRLPKPSAKRAARFRRAGRCPATSPT
jgi:hypothetical protein